MSDGPDRQDDHTDEDFAGAWEHGDEHDVGADTSSFETYRTEDDTAELLRRQVRGEDVPDEDLAQATEPGGHGPTSTGPSTTLILGILVIVFAVIAVLYILT